jgi:hypothetical protein
VTLIWAVRDLDLSIDAILAIDNLSENELCGELEAMAG